MKNEKSCILIADDDRQIRQILDLLLSSSGYEVIQARDGIEAAALACEEIDLYILDVNMPGQSGLMAPVGATHSAKIRTCPTNVGQVFL